MQRDTTQRNTIQHIPLVFVLEQHYGYKLKIWLSVFIVRTTQQLIQ